MRLGHRLDTRQPLRDPIRQMGVFDADAAFLESVPRREIGGMPILHRNVALREHVVGRRMVGAVLDRPPQIGERLERVAILEEHRPVVAERIRRLRVDLHRRLVEAQRRRVIALVRHQVAQEDERVHVLRIKIERSDEVVLRAAEVAAHQLRLREIAPRLRVLRLRDRPSPHRLQHLQIFFLRHGLLRFTLIFVLLIVQKAIETEQASDQRALNALLRGPVAAGRPRVRNCRAAAQRSPPPMNPRRIRVLLVIVVNHFDLRNYYIVSSFSMS